MAGPWPAWLFVQSSGLDLDFILPTGRRTWIRSKLYDTNKSNWDLHLWRSTKVVATCKLCLLPFDLSSEILAAREFSGALQFFEKPFELATFGASRAAIAPPPRAPIQRHIERHTPIIRVAPTDGNVAVLGIFLEVVSMQLTSQLQMGAIRARPSSLIASLRLESASSRSAIPSEVGLQLGPAKLNREGRISALRLIPAAKPFQRADTHCFQN